MNIPLHTERLALRQLTLDDADLMLAIWNDPAFIRNVTDRGIRTLDESRDAMTKGALQLYEDYGFGPYHVALKNDDTAIGICGIFVRDGINDPDIGFALLPEFCSRGYAWEAAKAVLDYARDELKLPRLTAIVAPGNAPSVGLIEKLGMQFETSMSLPGEDGEISLYGINFRSDRG